MTLTGSNDGQQSTTPEHDHRAALADAARQRDAAFDAWEAAGLPGSGPEFDAKDSAIANMAQVRAAANRDLGEKAADRLHAAADDATAQPTVSAFDEAAADAHPEPTDAQKEAGNYKKGHARWNGLDLSIENAKGSERRGTGPDGVEWSVTMPAHYGYFRGTEGADGDHVDFYMGDDPDVQHAYVIDQVDADTGAYDEAKVMLGYDAPQDARDAHSAAFSDGKGAARRGGMMKLTIPELKEWLASDKTKQPISRQAKAAERKRAQAPSAAAVQTTAPTTGILSSLSQEKQDRAADLKARLAAKVRNQASSGLDPEYITLGAELVALYIEGGARKFGEMLRDFAASTGLSIREAQAPMRAAYTHVRDDMDLNGEDISGMDDHASVMAEVRRAMAEESTQTPATQEQVQAPQVPATLQENAAPEAENDNRTDASDGGTRAQEGEADSGSRQGQAGSLRSSDRDAGRAGDRSAERARERSEPNTDGSGSGDGPRSRSRTGDAGAVNHVIEPGGLDLARGEKTRARESIAAIRVLRTIQQEGRPATADERVTLAKYGGAGTLAGTLPRSDGTIKHPDLAAEIEALTTPEERATLSRTSQYAFYTAESALRSMWKLAQQLGFTGGRVYEPGMGVGGFAGTMPGGVKATYTGLELDHLTAQIAQALYPRHAVKHGDFIKQKLPQGFYDLVIGNPPFAGTQIKADADYPQGFMIHDYFFAKSLDSVRPGGLLMFITSAGTMNKMDSKARDYLADRADLVGAIRLPNTAFKENGTEVTTDIIVLRKRTEGEAEADPAWRRSEVVDLPREDGATGQAAVNSYFVRHPEMILGDQGLYDTLTASDRVGVRPRKGSDLRTDLQAALAHFPTGIMSDAPASVQMDALDADHAETKAGSFYLKDGVLHQFDGNTGRPVEVRSKANAKGMPKAAMEAIKALIPIKNALRDVYSADVDGRDATAARRALNRAYDAYVKERGPIGLQQRREQRPSVVEMESARQQAENDARAAGEPFDIGSFDAGLMIEAGASMAEVARARKEARELTGYEEGSFDPEAMPNKMLVSRPNIDPFMDDPESYRLLAIERYDEKTDTATKTRVFTENAVKITARPQINSPEDALLHLLGETGSVDPARIAALANSTPERVIKELEGKIFQNPTTREWETKAKYLSGNVIQKLEEAEREARANPEYQPNVDALREVQPAPVAAADIAVPLGAHWFPARIYSDFAKSLGLDLKAEFKPRLGIWLVDGSKTGSAATTEWGTPDRPFGELMGLAMSNKKIEVRRSRRHPDGTTETWVDEEATQAANDKARELQDKFKEWFWSDESRTAEMERIYNRTFNAEVAPKYDGGYLTTPGIHSDWSWRPHQTSVIARILQSGDTYMAHTVGAGKTSAMIGAGMEAKRLGLAKKPWYSVPNHMLIQFATEFYQQYPLAKVLVADDRRFHTSRRKQFVADAALADSVSSILRQHGLAGKVSPKVLRGLLSASGVHVLGSYRAGGINVSASAADPAHVTRHEIIHALRDSSLWGRDHGLFTADEWRALVGAARRDAAIRSRVEEAYADQDTITQSEEMVAEFYADWAQSGRAAPAGPLGRALERIRSFFRAIASALRGEGFHDAAAIMERIADGEIGGRGPDGPGSGGRGSNQEKYNHDGDFVRAPNGSFSFGEISPEIATALGRQAGVIRLRRGDENCGLIHIERRHGDDIRRMGFTSIEDFVQVVARDFTAVYGRPGRALDLVLDGGERGMLIVQLEPHPSGDFYDIRTATPIRSGQYQRKEPLWERTGPRASSAVADPLNPKGQSGSINIGRVSDSGKDSEEKNQRDMSAIKAQLSRSKGRALGMMGNLHWKNAPGYFSSLLTDAMGRNDRFNLLSLVPGHPLFEELGKGMPAAQKYLREKQTMDAWRNDWQARGAAVVDGWTKQARKNPEANDRLMDLMHASTLAGIDPSKAGSWHQPVDDEARRTLKQPNLSAAKREWAHRMLRDANDRERTWQRLRADFDALPAEFRDLYQQIRDEYAAMADEQDAALMANIRTASKIALKRADREHRKELQRIRDEGLTGEARAEALEKANKRKTEAHARAARGGGARLQQLRQMFESNKLAGPYFPLTRFGNYFVTIRDEDGKVTSFSRFQTEREQRAWMQTATDRSLGKIEHGVLGGDANLKGKVDPTFVAEVESLLAEAGASDEMMDAVWRRWLETLPDQSVRTNRIHRKGRLGFNKDAMRAFSSAMFHGAHQTARLRHGLEMEDALDDAEEQAKHDPNPNRAGFVVREMRQRHAFTMSPTNNPLVSSASGLAFIWYLGMSPAAAIVNLSQTSIVGIPLLATRFKRAGVSGTAAELGRALRDFGAGRGWVERSDRLTTDEKAAMKAGYDRGVIDKTQSHDLAAVAESGVEYNPTREKVMRVIGFMFHHAERLNREVTFLAAYRMARAEGIAHAGAVDEASRQVWKVHFDYQNTSRPRVMQSDMGKILTTFRNFTVNMIYRLFRDTHQAFAGADAETRREARAQLIGISLSMFAHAGIKGVWGFGILSMLLGALLPGDDDDFENWLQDALLIEGDGAGVAAWNWTMAMALNGVPGTVLDMNLTNRIGMPDLWFRSPQKDLEGKDLWSYYVEQVAGPVAGIGGSVLTGASMLADGQWQRGSEKMVPKFGGDLIKTARYAGDGVTTYHGDPILDRVNPYQALTTALGFTPAEISERYRANSWLKNQEAKIEGERKSIMGDIARSIKSGDGVTPDLATRVREWNVKYPFYPITAQGMRQSIASRQRMSQRTQGGVNLNPKLDRYLREQVAPAAH